MTKRSLNCVVFVLVAASLSVSLARAADEDLGFKYVRRGDHIHFVGGAKTGNWPHGTRIDKPSKKNIRGFSRALRHPVKVCQSPDAASFEALSEEYTRDKNMVYYKWISPGRFLIIELPDADVKTFEVVGSNLAKDKNQVWYYGVVLPGADPSTLEVLNDRVWKDAQGVWYQHKRINGADTETFRHLASGYYADAGRVYWCDVPIKGADVTTFEVLGGSFVGRDRNMVYRSGKRLPHIDPATCKFILHNPYGYQVISDRSGVYLNKLKFLHANPKTFKMLDKRTGRDDRHVFLVDTWHSTPITVYKTGGLLVAETVLYEKGTTNGLATVKAELTGGKLKNMELSPPPGEAVSRPVPDWQIDIFQRPDMIKRMVASGDLLE